MSNMLELPTDRTRLRVTSMFDPQNLADAIDAMPGHEGINRAVLVPEAWLTASEDDSDGSPGSSRRPRASWRSWRSYPMYRDQAPIQTESPLACDATPGMSPRSNETHAFWQMYASSATVVMHAAGSGYQVPDARESLGSTRSRPPDAPSGIPGHERQFHDARSLEHHRKLTSIRRSRFGQRH